MYFVSVTRLRVKSFISLPRFFMANEASIKQLRQTIGFVEGIELVGKGLTFWTMTLWESESNMKEFRNSAPHRKAMQQLPDWCDEASYLHWMQEEKSLPDCETAYGKMITEGKTTKVRFPSANQISKSYPVIRWNKSGRKLAPEASLQKK